jgi:hypothetical protein
MFTLDQLKGPNGKVRTKSLFYELSYEDPSECLFTLKEQDIEVHGKHLLSLHKLYVSMVPSDPTEYDFAMTIFGSWDVWSAICKSPLVKNHVAKWRNEVEIKVKSQAIQAIAMEMKEGGRSSFSAAKLLLEKGWLDKDNASVAKKKLQAKEEEEQNKQALSFLSEDAERLGIKVN